MKKNIEVRWYPINGVQTMYYYKSCKSCGRKFHTRTYQQLYCTDRCKYMAQTPDSERIKKRILDEFIAENGYYKPELKEKKVKAVHISASAVVWR